MEDDLSFEFGIAVLVYLVTMAFVLPRRKKDEKRRTHNGRVNVAIAEMSLESRPILLFYAINHGIETLQLCGVTLYVNTRPLFSVPQPLGPLSFPHELKPGEKIHGYVAAAALLEHADTSRERVAVHAAFLDDDGKTHHGHAIGCDLERWRTIAQSA